MLIPGKSEGCRTLRAFAGPDRGEEMRRVLAGLAAAGALCACPVGASAGALSSIKLDYRGYFTGIAGGVEKNDTVPEVKDGASRSAAALRFKASTVFDNGIKLSFNTSFGLDGIESLVPNRGHVEDIYLELGTFFGTFTVGRQDGVAALMRVRTPSPIYGVYTENTELDMLELANVYTKLDLSGYNAKVTYQTPRIQGLQLGLSYLVEDVPTGAPVHVASAYDRRKSGAAAATEAGLNYSGKLGHVSLGAAATYYADNHDGIGERDPRGYNVGVELGLNGWTLGGNFTQGDHINHAALYSNNTRTTSWSAGLTYDNGGWKLGGTYLRGSDDPSGVNNKVDYQSIALGLTYLVRDGITLGLGVQHDKADPDPLGVARPTGGVSAAPGQSVDGSAVFFETGLKF